MRVIGFFICLLMFLGCKEHEHKENANTHRNVDSIIDCLNRKLISYDIGIDSLEVTATCDTVLSNIDSLARFLYRVYSATSTYNKWNIPCTLVYYQTDDKQSLLRLEKHLKDIHDNTYADLKRETIVRFNNMIVVFSVASPFDGSASYVNDNIKRLLLDYVNNCSDCAI